MVNQFSAAAMSVSTSSSITGAQAAAAFIKSRSKSIGKPEKRGEEIVYEEDGQLHLGVASRILKWHAEAVGRCIELSSAYDM